MALPVSSLSIMCNEIAHFVRTGLHASSNGIRVMIGPPAEAAKADKDQRVNLFFYRFEPSGIGPDGGPDEPWWIRLHCLITAMGIDEEESESASGVSAGENELRMLGEVMRIFHETPVMAAVDVNGQQVRLQVVFQPLSADDLNHIWSTQGDTSYRPSAAYEIALGPIVPSELRSPGLLVGATGLEVRADMASRHELFSGAVATPPVRAQTIDTGPEDWAPRICFVEGDQCLASLAFAAPSPELTAFSPTVWVAGDTSATVTLRWEEWHEDGWRPAGTATGTNPISAGIDPEAIPASGLEVLGLPLSSPLPTGVNSAQALLYAVRQYTRASDQSQREVRSNPLLVTLYWEGP